MSSAGSIAGAVLIAPLLAVLVAGCAVGPDAFELESAILCLREGGVDADLDDGVIVIPADEDGDTPSSQAVIADCVPEAVEMRRAPD